MKYLHIEYNNFLKEIAPLLKEEIFHITSYKNYKKIVKDGYIKAGQETKRPDSYFYQQECISLFDYREQNAKKGETIDERFEEGRLCYHEPEGPIVALLLNHNKYNKIIKAPKNAGEKGIIIHHIEVGYKDKISIKDIYKTIIIDRKINKPKIGSLGRLHEENNKKSSLK